jgi:hypothetical protein
MSYDDYDEKLRQRLQSIVDARQTHCQNCGDCGNDAQLNRSDDIDKRLQRKTRKIQNQTGAPTEVAQALAFAEVNQEPEQRREPSFPTNYESLNHEEKMRYLRRLRLFEEGR